MRKYVTKILIVLIAVLFAVFGKSQIIQKPITESKNYDYDITVIDKNINVYADTDYSTIGNFTEKQSGREYGKYQLMGYNSSISKSYKEIWVYVPHDYSCEKKYPVLYLLHGMGGDLMSWYNMNPGNIMENAHYDNGGQEMIIVIPSVYTSAEHKSEEGLEIDERLKGYDAFCDEFQNDLIPFINKKYSVKTDKNSTAISGYSFGGRESVYIGLKFPDQIGYIGALSPTDGIISSQSGGKIIFQNYDYNKIKDNFRLIFLYTGSNDSLFNEVKGYSDEFNSNNINNMFCVTDGTHDSKAWQIGLYNFVRRLFI